MVTLFSSLEDRVIEKMEKRMEERLLLIEKAFENKMTNANKEIQKTFDNRITDANKVYKELDSKMEEKVEEKVGEMEEREKRQHNIILFNFPESKFITKTEARSDDIKRAKELIQTVVELDEDDELTEPVRLGGKKPEDGRPRGLRLRVSNIETKKEILRYARNLNDRDTPQADRIYINADQTPAEREHYKRLI